jgi:uncharacterized repeat protein (TIGR03803 family)
MKIKTEIKNGSWTQFKKNVVMRPLALALCLAAASSAAQTFAVLHNFGDVAGQFPGVNVVTDGTSLYGMTRTKVFKMNLDGTGCTVLCNWGDNQPAPSEGGLVLSGSTLYAATRGDLSSWHGSVFKINTDGSGFTVLKQFTGDSDGGEPCAAPILSGSTVFGTTYFGGNSNCGVVFKVNTDGTGFTVLKQFTGGSDGGKPYGTSLMLSDTTLYGTTTSGGNSNCGVVFKVNTDGTDFTVLHHFTGGGGGSGPMGNLTLCGTTFYGTTLSGGIGPYEGDGIIFKINTDGSDFTVLNQFGLIGGRGPMGSLAFCGTTLSGCTSGGGTSGAGIAFKINMDGSGFTTLKQFNSTDGAAPRAGLVLFGSTLYGTAWLGGSLFNSGVLFTISLPPPIILAVPQNQTAELGSTVRFQVRASPQPLTYYWYFNGTNPVTQVCTNSWLELTNVQTSQSGTYTVSVTNAFGLVTTPPPAMLNVISAVQRRSVPDVKVTGETGSVLNVDYANSLSPAPNWTTLGSASLTSTSQFYFDLSAQLPPQRFYRAWQTGTPSVVPSLNLNFVPAITLTGKVGDSLRLDYINQFGPTDAWVTLDTVTLTNMLQLYFDVFAPGQPVRLYRIVPVP